MSRQGLESFQGNAQLLTEALCFALFVMLLHAFEDSTDISLKSTTQQQIRLIEHNTALDASRFIP